MTANTVERSDFLSYRRLVKSRVLCKVASRCARGCDTHIPRAARRAYDAIGSAPDHLSSSRRREFPRSFHGCGPIALGAHARMRSGCRDPTATGAATLIPPRAGEFLLRACALDTRYTRVPARRKPARRRGPRSRKVNLSERRRERYGFLPSRVPLPLPLPPVRARGENVITALSIITIINR